MATVLVTGGAGYIGSHACKALAARGHHPVAYDDFSLGWRDAVRFGPAAEGDIRDRARLDAAFAEWRPDAVMHFAAASDVGESGRDPGKYWRINVDGTRTLLEAAVAAGCGRVVHSSTCAIYGDQGGAAIDEGTTAAPLNAYGRTKHAVEQMLADFEAAHGLRHVVFRYFNVAGADPGAELGEAHRPETHLIPLLFEAIEGEREALTVNGTDYDTPDGTCIRDFVHVSDLVEAHRLGLDRLIAGGGSRDYNLGSGTGFSVREVARTAETVTGRRVPTVDGPRRPGDAVRLVSASGRAAGELGWRPERSELATMIGDAWRWRREGGYAR